MVQIIKELILYLVWVLNGIDFYPNQLIDAQPVSIIVSDPDSKSMRYDINVELVQIVGRFRKHKITNKRVNNPVIYFWNTQKSDYFLSEEEFFKKTNREHEDAIRHLESMKDNEMTREITLTALYSKGLDHIILEGKQPILHPYGTEAKMSTYQAMHSDSSIMGNLDSDNNLRDDSIILNKLSELSPELSNYEVPTLTVEYTKALGRIPSVKNMIQEYELLEEEYHINYKDDELRQECQDAIDNFLILNPIFAEWINSGITTAMMRTNRLNRNMISQKATENRTLLCNTSEVKAQMEVKVGETYTKAELLEKVINIYKSLNIEKNKPKATDIKTWYNIKSTSKRVNGSVVSAYKIIKEH